MGNNRETTPIFAESSHTDLVLILVLKPSLYNALRGLILISPRPGSAFQLNRPQLVSIRIE